MFLIARRQLIEGLLDAKFLFLSVLILIAFFSNAFIYSDSYAQEREDYQKTETESTRLLSAACDNLQRMAVFQRYVVSPPSPLSFIADGGSKQLPNAIPVNAFVVGDFEFQQRSNERIPILPALDWVFIVGVLMSLLTLLLSYGSVSGEKRDGTLRLVLSNPVSRLSLFFGKYLGLLSALIICLLAGIILNLVTIFVAHYPPLTGEALWQIGWVVLLSVLYISLFLLVGIAVSAFSRSSSVALVLLLVIWVVTVIAIPGAGRLIAELSVPVPTQAQVQEEINRRVEEIEANAPVTANYWDNDPFAANVPDRAKLWKDEIAADQQVNDDFIRSQIRQAVTARNLSSVSPYGLLSNTLMKLSETGIYGFERLFKNSRQYKQNLYQFVVNRDRTDPNTPHLVYGATSWFDAGVFSTKPVPIETVPRPANLWSESGLSLERPMPLEQLIILVAANLVMAFVAIISLIRIDPR